MTRVKKILEKTVVKSIARWLGMIPEVIWFERLNSGSVNINGRFIKMCRAGTPDFIALIRNKNNIASILFIEAKRPGAKIKKDSPQDIFRKEIVLGASNIRHITAHSEDDVYDAIYSEFQ